MKALLDIQGFDGEMLREIEQHEKIEEAEGCNCWECQEVAVGGGNGCPFF
jgi:hypothetical protein